VSFQKFKFIKVWQHRIHSGSLTVVPPRSSQSQVGTHAFHSGIGGLVHGAGLLDVCLAIFTILNSAQSFYQLVSDTVIDFQGLTIVQVSQNQAAVVSDPQNHVFVIKNAGFVAYAIEGTYNVLSIVDQTHLPSVIKDKLTGITLGSTHEVKMKSKVGNGQEKEYVVATLLVFGFFPNI
jgi:hypothetical protein